MPNAIITSTASVPAPKGPSKKKPLPFAQAIVPQKKTSKKK